MTYLRLRHRRDVIRAIATKKNAILWPMRMLAVLLLLVCASRCSLSPSPPTVMIRMQSTASNSRSGPPIAEFQYYALVVSGNLNNTLATNSLENRSLSCLYANGTVIFPLTYTQLTKSGVSLNLASGTYRFSVLGFHGAIPTNATTLPQLFVPNSPPQEYVLAQNTVDISSKEIQLTSTYSASTPDRVPNCVPATAGFFTNPESFIGISKTAGAGNIEFLNQEGSNPPLLFNTTPMQILDQLIGTTTMPPGQLGSYHLRVDALFAPPSDIENYNEVVVVATGEGGTALYSNPNCINPITTEAAFQIGLWDNRQRGGRGRWVTDSYVTGTAERTLRHIVPPSSLLVGGRLLISIRVDAFGDGGNCGVLNLTGLNVRGSYEGG